MALVWDKDFECLVDKASRHNQTGVHDKRSGLAAPMVINDTLPRAIKSMADGRVYEGKRGYYKSVQRAGAEIVGFEKDVQRHTAKAVVPNHEADIVADTKAAIEIEHAKLPPNYSRAGRVLAKQQARKRRMSPASATSGCVI